MCGRLFMMWLDSCQLKIAIFLTNNMKAGVDNI